MPPENFHIIIVGAGPSGLLLALLLAQHAIPVTVLEKSTEIDRNPRASFYSAPVLKELRRAGLMPDIMVKAFVPDGVCWRAGLGGGPVVSSLRASNPPGKETIISLPLDELLPIMAAHVGRCETARVLLGHEVVAIGEDGARAWVRARTADGERTFEGVYVVGCDGAGSKIRRALFGNAFPGFMWEKQIVATNVFYPRFHSFDWTSSTFQIDAAHFPMVAQIARDGLLRVSYGEQRDLTHDQMRERLPRHFARFLPGAPGPDEYEVRNFSPYKIHQRCAESFRKGRFLLAADAAHLCNPFGGMGLTGGLVDVGNLFDCLYGIYTGQADDTILDKYSEIRIQKWKDVIDPISSGNIRRLWDASEEAIENDAFFQMVKRAEVDEEFAEQMSTAIDSVTHDFTQYYQKARR